MEGGHDEGGQNGGPGARWARAAALPATDRSCAHRYATAPSTGPEDSTFLVQCSYLEVYNDRLNDLLGDKSNLMLREKPGVGLTVEGAR